ncbi:EscJ/YscJ/HrcJ family type III secretion inner membrane ring protein [Pseudoduganella eburnea]|uniref:Lipoprotein n=1 Tax=Massilia eburnea TaxID=1776165 RepID=A0A6L6QL18_9BURK|nr:type III secretion inner membrane ring lipoprotein SctJ [Massilia eburnea]MTW12627.1 EscJ/YscJ/HrcJ family type III secretion inner membrane ring protein [Massilia eburnea]
MENNNMSIRMKRCLAYGLLLAGLLFLSGCEQAVYSNLSEQQANDVLLTLLKGGISAEKRAGEKGYGVWVDSAKMAPAISLLNANGQPPQHYTEMGDIFARNNLISSPTEERIRFTYGTEQAIAKTLSQIDGVLSARVHIVLPSNDPLASPVKPSSASVFLKYRADINMKAVIPEVKELVIRSVEGLTVDKVSVSLFPARATGTASDQVPTARIFGIIVANSSVATLWIMMLTPWIVAAVLLILLLNAVHLRTWLKGKLTARNATQREVRERPARQRERA